MIDTHAHLCYSDARGTYEGGAAGVIARAVAAGVTHINCVGAGGELAEVVAALDAARTWRGVSAICGIHPHDAARLAEGAAGQALWAGVQEACAQPECVAVGETGLDFHYNLSDREAQFAAFAAHIGLARDLGKPLCIHTRNAEPETLGMLLSEQAVQCGGVIHCFSGTADFGLQCVEELGFYLSIPGIVTFKNAGEIPAAVVLCPLDRLIIETDSPFLAPIPYRGKRCEPAYIGQTLAKVAELKGLPMEEMRAVTTANAIALFGDRLREPLA